MPNYYAFLVGPNYIGTPNELHGCVDDIEDMKRILVQSGVPDQNVKMLSDAYEGAENAASRENVLNGLKALVKKAKPGDIIFFHYSGHGTNSLRRVNDYEAICPIKDGEIELIADFELHAIIKDLVPGAKFVSALDCCHSGDMFNLENNLYEHKLTHYDKSAKAPEQKAETELHSDKKAASKDKKEKKHKKHEKPEKEKDAEQSTEKGFLSDLVSALKPHHHGASTSSGSNTSTSLTANLHGYVVVLSGCEIKQTSADAVVSGRPQGAFTACLKAMIEKHGFHEILDVFLSSSKAAMKPLNDEMIDWLKERGYSQRPDFSFEGQLAPLQKALMVQPELISKEERKAILNQFALLIHNSANNTTLRQSVTPVQEARNDGQEIHFPVRKKMH